MKLFFLSLISSLVPQGQCVIGDTERFVGVRKGGQGECEDHWRWSLKGLLKAGEKGCLSSRSGHDKTQLKPCDSRKEDQIVEVGVDDEIDGKKIFNM